MTEQIKLIAERLKGFREIAEISPESLAKKLGVSNTVYSNYESGQTDIPVGFLMSFAQHFNIELSVLLSGENPKLRVYCVVRKGKGLKEDRRKQYKYESLATNFINKKAQPFMVTVEPSADNVSVDFNSHPGQEYNYVIEGSMKLFIDTHEIILNEGDSIYFDSGFKHAMKALNNKDVKFLAIIL
jgi:quercetin dioxygenase-like cupin family protein/DNA-binding XRE family transcriptional regulator